MNFNFADEHKAHKRNVQNLKANFHLFSRDLIQEHIYFLRGKGRGIVFNLTSIELEFLIFRFIYYILRQKWTEGGDDIFDISCYEKCVLWKISWGRYSPPPHHLLMPRAFYAYTWCALEYSHDPNLDSSTNRRANIMNETN